MRTFKATRTIIQEATIKAESRADAANMIQAPDSQVEWTESFNGFNVFDALEDENPRPPAKDW